MTSETAENLQRDLSSEVHDLGLAVEERLSDAMNHIKANAAAADDSTEDLIDYLYHCERLLHNVVMAVSEWQRAQIAWEVAAKGIHGQNPAFFRPTKKEKV